MEWTNSYSMEQTGAFLKRIRKGKGITQADFAEMIGVSHATLSALETGKPVSSATLEKAMNYLGLRMVIVPKSAAIRVAESSAHQGVAQ